MISFKNRLLSSLAADEIAFLLQHLEAVDLPLRMALTLPGAPIDHVVFIEDGLGSVIVVVDSVDQIEVGLIGRDGVSGISAALGSPRSEHKTFMQVGGNGYRLPVAVLDEAMASRPAIRQAVLRFANEFLLQVSQTALANGRFALPARLARWLLMSHDRLDGDVVPLTNEFLGLMLGVRRAGVTEALADLEALGCIDTGKGRIKVLNRAALVHMAMGIYSE